MITNPDRYKSKRNTPSLIEEKLNDIYRLVTEYETENENTECGMDLSIIKDDILNIHTYFTNVMKQVAVENKKYILKM